MEEGEAFTSEDIRTICRLCWCKKDTLHPVTENIESLFECVMKVKLQHEPETQICIECQNVLERFREFKIQCLENEHKLLLAKEDDHDIKIEFTETQDEMTSEQIDYEKEIESIKITVIESEPDEVSLEEIVQRMISSDTDEIILDYGKSENVTLAKVERILEYGAEFAINLYHDQDVIAYNDRRQIAQALVQIFPKIFNSELALVHPDETGVLDDEIARLQGNKGNSGATVEVSNKEKYMMEMSKLQNPMYNSKRILRKTFPQRRNYFEKYGNLDFILPFSAFKANPYRLINYEFELYYRGKGKRLLTVWPNFADAIELLSIESATDLSQYPDDVKQFLMLHSLVCNEIDDYTELIQFRLTRTKFTLTPAAKPYIVGIYSKKLSNIVQYWLVSGKNVLKMETVQDFLSAMDLLYKVYHIFHIKYPTRFTEYFQFIEEFIYGTKQFGNAKNTSVNSHIHENLSSDVINQLAGKSNKKRKINE